MSEDEPKGTHRVEALLDVEADDAEDARHIALGLMSYAIKGVRVMEVRSLPLDDNDLIAEDFVLTPDELQRMWDNSPPVLPA